MRSTILLACCIVCGSSWEPHAPASVPDIDTTASSKSVLNVTAMMGRWYLVNRPTLSTEQSQVEEQSNCATVDLTYVSPEMVWVVLTESLLSSQSALSDQRTSSTTSITKAMASTADSLNPVDWILTTTPVQRSSSEENRVANSKAGQAVVGAVDDDVGERRQRRLFPGSGTEDPSTQSTSESPQQYSAAPFSQQHFQVVPDRKTRHLQDKVGVFVAHNNNCYCSVMSRK